MSRSAIISAAVCLAISATIGFLPARGDAQVATSTTADDSAAIAALLRRYYEIASSGELENLSEVLAPGFTIQNAPLDEDAGVDGLIFSLNRARASRPDFRFRIDDIIVDGNMAVIRTTISGTHLGDFFGMPPTGKWIEIQAIDLWRIERGRLAAVWHFEDILGMMEQIAAIEAATPQSAASDTTPSPISDDAPVATPDAAIVAANEVLARRFRDGIMAGSNLDVADDILTSGFVWHAEVAPGVDGVKAFARGYQEAFPDLTLSADQVVAAGDRVAILWTLSGTHEGEFLGVPPTGNPVSTAGIDIYHIDNGRIAEIWTVGDDLGLLFQLGAFPSSGTAAATPDNS